MPAKKGTLLHLTLAMVIVLAVWMKGEEWLRAILIYLSESTLVRNFVSANPLAWQVAKRFVAGEEINGAIEATKTLNAQGMTVTMDYLGESVDDERLAIVARDTIAELLDAIAKNNIKANVSLKLTQLGMDIDENLAYENLHYLLKHAQKYGNKIRVDMEDSPWVDATLDMYRKLRDEEGLDNVGVVIQSYLYRSDDDIAKLVAEGAWVRLVKGAYLEPSEVAYPNKVDTDSAYVRQMEMLLAEKARNGGVYAGIGTHDENMIQATIRYAETNNISPQEYEFQMLYGVRRDRQESLVANGYKMRVYVPFGQAWYPYFMRRLAERPANMWFFLSNFFK